MREPYSMWSISTNKAEHEFHSLYHRRNALMIYGLNSSHIYHTNPLCFSIEFLEIPRRGVKIYGHIKNVQTHKHNLQHGLSQHRHGHGLFGCSSSVIETHAPQRTINYYNKHNDFPHAPLIGEFRGCVSLNTCVSTLVFRCLLY